MPTSWNFHLLQLLLKQSMLTHNCCKARVPLGLAFLQGLQGTAFKAEDRQLFTSLYKDWEFLGGSELSRSNQQQQGTLFLVPGIWGGPRCCQFLTLHKKQHDRRGWGGWGGVGWDNSVICCTFSCTCTHTSCYAAVRSHALAHISHATLLYVLMHLHTYVMLRCCTFSCTCTHTSCDAAVRSHALAHICHATLLYVLMHLHTYVMLRCCTFSCTCTHTSCYAAVRSHALAHIRHATLLYVLMHLHTYVMRRCCTFSCTCTHTKKGKLNPALYE